MTNKKCCIIIFSIIISMWMSMCIFAGKLDPTIPTFSNATMNLTVDGVASFVAPVYAGTWKRFGVQLLKRVSSIDPITSAVTYTYKTSGSIKYAKPDETECEMHFPSVGYYQFQIRGENLEGNYGEWMRMSGGPAYDATYAGLAVEEDDLSIGSGGSGSGSGSGSAVIGPDSAYTSSLPAGYQYAVIGPNGQVMYYYNSAAQTAVGTTGINTQQYGPGYSVNNGTGYINGTQNVTPNTGVSGYPVVTAPNTGTTTTGTYTYDPNTGTYYYSGATVNNNVGTTTGQSSLTNPNYSTGVGTGQSSYSPGAGGTTASPQITQGLEIGWHVDNNGRFYYQGNGQVLKGTWYYIDGNYYRFGNTGYLLTNQWFKDTATGYWYYLAGDGRMLTGWQCINGTWYYFKPENGNGFGTMYANTSLQINDNQYGSGIYAFDANGAMVKNAWYGGYYYGNDGKRTS